MNWVDVVLLVVVAAAAVHGLRLGAAIQVMSFGGFWLGLFLGALFTPRIAEVVSGQTAKTVVAAVVVFGSAGLLAGVGRVLGARSGPFLQRWHLGPVDAFLGLAVAVVATLVAVWLVASVLVNSRYETLAHAIAGSQVVKAVDGVLHQPPDVFSRIEGFLAGAGIPVVFTGLPPQLAGPVPLPDAAEVSAAVGSAGPSTVQIVGEGCGVIQEGSGFVVAPGVVVTNAHVVAGMPDPDVIESSGRHLSTLTELFDPELDIAVLKVPELSAPPLALDGQMVGRGTQGVVLGYPNGGPFSSVPAGVLASFEATGLDIYGKGHTTRSVYELGADVQPGNSGGPLIYESSTLDDPLDGKVIGVVFARSTSYNDVGYALAIPAVLNDVHRAMSSSGTVNNGPCTSS